MPHKLAETLQNFENALSNCRLTVAESALILRSLDFLRNEVNAAVKELTENVGQNPPKTAL